ncbi:hypothetical protein CC78DRAFT_24456 [Lojkania enalia]|uniref:Uncharacterized protein n=1 Tax=Lojkania enalia TaxID=147567 RepID=A0A9P4K3F1_9PLEO|nr:hypothetical protein CC78DRAFT_24456 [Didymosphaeria enalia]
MPSPSSTPDGYFPVHFHHSPLEEAIQNFLHHLSVTVDLIHTHGPFRLHDGTIFVRAGDPNTAISTLDIASSFAAAQDAPIQTLGPASADLQTFTQLWTATKRLLDAILDSHSLPQDSFNWGVLGLASGGMDPDEGFVALKDRLKSALTALPNLEMTMGRDRGATEIGTRLDRLVRANREVHACSRLLLAAMRGWGSLRWFHAVCVAERWAGSLGYRRGERSIGGRGEGDIEGEEGDEIGKIWMRLINWKNPRWERGLLSKLDAWLAFALDTLFFLSAVLEAF